MFLIVVVASVACGKPAEKSAALTLEELTDSWSRGAKPMCEEIPAGISAGQHRCAWPWVVTPADSGQLTGQLESRERFLFINWNRRFVDSTSGLRFRDSLGQVLRARGLSERECKYRGRRWESPRLGVEVVLDSVPNGRWVASVFATAEPEAIPTLFCPAQPRMPVRST